MKNKFGILFVSTALAAVALACSASTASLSSFKISKDKDGSQETSSFKAGETLYANAVVSASISKTTVKFTLVAEDAPPLKKGDIAPGSEVKVELPSSGTAQYHLTIPPSFQGGKYTVVADMINEAGEKKDSKSTSVTIAAGSGSTAPPADKPKEDKDDDN